MTQEPDQTDILQGARDYIATNPRYKSKYYESGDIVIFENHIGIVSEHRNDDGIAYVIHHKGTLQKA